MRLAADPAEVRIDHNLYDVTLKIALERVTRIHFTPDGDFQH